MHGCKCVYSSFNSLVAKIVCQAGKDVKTARQTIVPDPDYRIPIALLGDDLSGLLRCLISSYFV